MNALHQGYGSNNNNNNVLCVFNEVCHEAKGKGKGKQFKFSKVNLINHLQMSGAMNNYYNYQLEMKTLFLSRSQRSDRSRETLHVSMTI